MQFGARYLEKVHTIWSSAHAMSCSTVTVLMPLMYVFGLRYLDLINKICIYWTASSVVIILVTLLVMADDGRRSGEFVFANYNASDSGW